MNAFIADLYALHHAGIAALASRLLNDEAEGADVAQDVFVRCSLKLSSIDDLANATPHAAKAYLYRATRNIVIECVRRKQMQSRVHGGALLSLDLTFEGTDDLYLEPADAGAHVEKQVERDQLRTQVRQAVSALQPIHRDVVLMHHVAGMEVKAIARAQGVQEGTVKSRLARARTHLANRLGPQLFEDYRRQKPH